MDNDTFTFLWLFGGFISGFMVIDFIYMALNAVTKSKITVTVVYRILAGLLGSLIAFTLTT